MTDMLLSSSTNMTLSQGQTAFFYKDQPGEMESASAEILVTLQEQNQQKMVGQQV